MLNVNKVFKCQNLNIFIIIERVPIINEIAELQFFGIK